MFFFVRQYLHYFFNALQLSVISIPCGLFIVGSLYVGSNLKLET